MATPLLTDNDGQLLAEGKHYRIYDKLGAHVLKQDGTTGTHFAVWAPDALRISVIGDFNGWQAEMAPLTRLGASGLWQCFIPDVGVGARYKYAITFPGVEEQVDKLDPYGFATELGTLPVSIVSDLSDYTWGDQNWLAGRVRAHGPDVPLTIYEVHLGSWMRVPEEGNRSLTYRELTPKLLEYVHRMGYTHVELLPVTEHLAEDSWGYDPLAYFAPTSRFGTPQDFMFLVDTLHRQGIGVILDWVPAQFPQDEQGQAYFARPRREHQDWRSQVSHVRRPEVGNFLISNAFFWLDKYHTDGLRLVGIPSLLYLDPSQAEETQPSEAGGQDQETSPFIRRFHQVLFTDYPDTLTIAEESPAWRRVSRPTHLEGAGFSLKRDLGWVHESLKYLAFEPAYRKHHHNQLTFRMLYAFTENYLLPLSHEEVVHGQRSLLSKMPGDNWQQFANLRLLFGYLYGEPGKKLLFMGGEFGQRQEWRHDASLDWHLLEEPLHQGLQRWVRDLNTVYRGEPALHQRDCDSAGFEWIDYNDAEHCVLSFLRKGQAPNDLVLFVYNFTLLPRYNYRVGVSQTGHWDEILNSDAPLYGGSGQGNLGGARTTPVPWHGRSFSLNLTLPPLGMVAFKKKP